MSEQATIDAIRKTISVACGPGDAFRVFTQRIGEWWPKAYSLGGERTEGIVLEPRTGGRVYEVDAEGREHAWGTVTAYEPPHRLVLSWGLNGSEVEVRFQPAEGGTRLELEHRGWEHLEDGQERAQYDVGWDAILARYRTLAGADASRPGLLRKEVRVGIAPAEAFSLFTERIATWWPLQSHSVGHENAETLVFEPGVGGRIYERARTGEEHVWGAVIEWAPPHGFVLTWHPGRPDTTAQRVETRFLPDAGGTRVVLEHSGWQTLGADAEETFASYVAGWDYVLGERLAAAAAKMR